MPNIPQTLGNIGKFGGEWLLNMADPQRQQFKRAMELQRQRNVTGQANWLTQQSILHRNALEMQEGRQAAESAQNEARATATAAYRDSTLGQGRERLDISKTRLMGEMTNQMLRNMRGFGGAAPAQPTSIQEFEYLLKQGVAQEEARDRAFGYPPTPASPPDPMIAAGRGLNAAYKRYEGMTQPTRTWDAGAQLWAGGGDPTIPSTPQQRWNARQDISFGNARMQGRDYQREPWANPTQGHIQATLANPQEMTAFLRAVDEEPGYVKELEYDGVDVQAVIQAILRQQEQNRPPLPQRPPPGPSLYGGMKSNLDKLPIWGQPPNLLGF